MEIGELLRAGGCLTPGLRDFLCLPRSHDGEDGGPTYQDSIRFYLADQDHVESLTNQGILPCPAFWSDAKSVTQGRAHLNIVYRLGDGPVRMQTLPFKPIKIQPVRDTAPGGPRRLVCRAFLPEKVHLALYRIELCLFPRLESVHKALMGPQAAQLVTKKVHQGLELSLAINPTDTLLLSVNLRLACLELRSPMHILQSDGRLGPAPPCLRSVSSLEEARSMLMAGKQRLMRPDPSRIPDRSTARKTELVEPVGIGHGTAQPNQAPPMQPASSPGGRTETIPTSHHLDSIMTVNATILPGPAPSPAKPPLPAARGGGLLQHALRLLRSDPTSAAPCRDACALLGRCLPDGAARAVGAGALEALAAACRHSAEVTEEHAALLASTTLALLQANDDEPTRQQVVLAVLKQLADTTTMGHATTEGSGSTSGPRSSGLRNGEQLRSQMMLLNVLDRLVRTRPGLQPVAVSVGALCLLESVYLSAETDNDLLVQAVELQGIAFQECGYRTSLEERPIQTTTVAVSTSLASRRSPGRFAPSPLQLPDFLSDGESSYAGSPTKSLYAGSLPPSPPPRGRQDLVVPRLQLPGTSGASSPSRVPSAGGLLSPMACSGERGALELSRKQTAAASFSLGSGGRAVGGLTRSTRRRAATSGDRTTTQLSPDGHRTADCLSDQRSSATATPAYQLERLGKAVAEGVAASCLPSVTALRRTLLSEHSNAALIGDNDTAVGCRSNGQTDVREPSGIHADIGVITSSHARHHTNVDGPLLAHRICVQDSSQGSDAVFRRSEHGAASSMSVCTLQRVCLELWSSLVPLAPTTRPCWDGTKLFEALVTVKALKEHRCSNVMSKGKFESQQQQEASCETAALKLLSGRALARTVLSGYNGQQQIKLKMISARSPEALRALADSLTCSNKALSTPRSEGVLLLVRDVIYAAISSVNLGSWSEEHWETYAAAISVWSAAVDVSRSTGRGSDAQRGLLALAFEDLGLSPQNANSPSSNNNINQRSVFPRSSTALDLVQAAVSQLLSIVGLSIPSSARAQDSYQGRGSSDKETNNAGIVSISNPGVKLKQTIALLTMLGEISSEISPLRRRDATRPGSDIVLRGHTRRGLLRALGFLLGPEYGLASFLLCTLGSSDEQDTMLFRRPSSPPMQNVTVSLQQAAFDYVTTLFGAVGSPHALHRPTTDFYVRHHFVQFLRLYHNPGRDPRAIAQCRRHLSVLLALARGAGPGVRSGFHQLSALEFFARELSLETTTALQREPSRSLSATPGQTTLLKRKDPYQVKIDGQDCRTGANSFSVPRLLFGDKQTPGTPFSSSQRRSGSGDRSNGPVVTSNRGPLPRTSSLGSSTRIAKLATTTASLPAKIQDDLLDEENRTLSSEAQSGLQLTGDLEEDLELLERLEEEEEAGTRMSALDEEDSDDGALRQHHATPARKIGLALPPSSARSDETSDSADLSPTIPAHHVGGRRAPALLSSLTGGVPALSLNPAQKKASPPKFDTKFAARIVPVTTGPNARSSGNRLNARLGSSLLPRLALPAGRSTLMDREAAAHAHDQAELFDEEEEDVANGTSDESSSASSQSGHVGLNNDDAHQQQHGSRAMHAVSFSDLPGQRHRRRKSGFQSASALQGQSAEDHSNYQLYGSPLYRTERARRLLYDSTELHLQILELVFCQLIGMPRMEGLDRSTTDPFPLPRGMPNVPFILQRHLSHPSNAALVPELASRLASSPSLGEPALRLLRLVSGEFFRPEWYADRARQQGSNGAYATIYCCRLPPFLCPPKHSMSSTSDLRMPTISNKNEDNNNNLVVLKVLDAPSAMQDRCSFVDVYGEVGTMCALSSSLRFAHLLDYGFDPGEGTHTLVMPQYTCSLKQWRLGQGAAQGETTTWQYLCIFQEILRAVKDLGDKGIAHFDLKCDNVLIQRRQDVSEREFWNPGTFASGSGVVAPSSGSLSWRRSQNSSGQKKLPFDIVLADFGESVRFSEETAPACGRSISGRDNAGRWGSCSSLSGAPSPLSHETGSAWAGSSAQDSGKSNHHRNQIDVGRLSVEYDHDEEDGTMDDSEHFVQGVNEEQGGRTCQVRGTDAFKSPEMLLLGRTGPSTGVDRRRPKGVGPASDVWSLGCLLYELLTGELLVKDTDWASLVARVASGRLPLFTPDRVKLLQGHPFTLDLIQWMLVRDPERRPSLDDIDKRLSGVMVRLGGISSSRDAVLSSRQSSQHDLGSVSVATSAVHAKAKIDPKEDPTLIDAIQSTASQAGLWKERKPQPLARSLTPVIPGLGMCPLAATPSIMRRHAFFYAPADRRIIILLHGPSRHAAGSCFSSSPPCKGGSAACWQTSSPLSSICPARNCGPQYAVSPEPSPIKAGHKATAVSVNPLFASSAIAASPIQGAAGMEERSLNSGGTQALLGGKKERKKPRSLWAMLTGADVHSTTQIACDGDENEDRSVRTPKSPPSRQPTTSSLQRVAVPRFSSIGLSTTRTRHPGEESVARVLDSQDEDAIMAAQTATALGVPWKAVYCPIDLERQPNDDGQSGNTKSKTSLPILRAWLQHTLDHLHDRKQENVPLSTGREDLSAGVLLVSLQSGTEAAAVLLVLAALRQKGLSMLETMTTASHWGLDTHIERWLLDALPELLNLE